MEIELLLFRTLSIVTYACHPRRDMLFNRLTRVHPLWI